MKNIRFLLALAVAGLFATSFARAEDKKDEGKAKCCLKAEAKGEKCSHDCCVAAAKDGKNCEKCGGKNEPVAKK